MNSLQNPDSPAGFLESWKGHWGNVTFGALFGPANRREGDGMESKLPAKRALAALDTATPAPAEPIAQRRISKKVRTGIGFMVSGDCKIIKDAVEKVGLSREHFTRELSKPHIAAYMRERVLKQLAIAAARAGAVKIDLVDSDNAMVADRASSFILGLAGIAPATTPALNVNLEIRAGYVIDLSGRRDDPADNMRIVSPTVYSPPAIDADLEQDGAE
jgi:hypothetical protein